MGHRKDLYDHSMGIAVQWRCIGTIKSHIMLGYPLNFILYICYVYVCIYIYIYICVYTGTGKKIGCALPGKHDSTISGAPIPPSGSMALMAMQLNCGQSSKPEPLRITVHDVSRNSSQSRKFSHTFSQSSKFESRKFEIGLIFESNYSRFKLKFQPLW